MSVGRRRSIQRKCEHQVQQRIHDVLSLHTTLWRGGARSVTVIMARTEVVRAATLRAGSAFGDDVVDPGLFEIFCWVGIAKMESHNSIRLPKEICRHAAVAPQ